MNDTADVAALADALRPAILRLSRHLRRDTQIAGVSAIDAQLLGLISKRPGIGVSELAAIEQMSRPSMSVHLTRLQKAGLLDRECPAESDQRRVRLMLTAEGRAALLAIRRSRNDWLIAQISQLSVAERKAIEQAIAPIAALADHRA